MKKTASHAIVLTIAGKLRTLFSPLLLGCWMAATAAAQTAPPAPQQPAPAAQPLNLDSDEVAKEMSKEQHPADTKPDVLSSTQNLFEQSILNSENHKKISGMVEAGAGVGNIPAQHGYKSENFTCENTAVGINDEISRTTQVAIYAQADTCKTR